MWQDKRDTRISFLEMETKSKKKNTTKTKAQKDAEISLAPHDL